MFIEKICKLDVERFAHQFECSIVEYKKISDGKCYVRMFTGAMGPQPEFNLSDFYCKSVNSYFQSSENSIQECWRRFMCERFGAKYKEAFKQEIKRVTSEMENSIM